MGKKLIDLAGKRFGSWTVICRGEDYFVFGDAHRIPRWICRCDCGNVSLVLGNSLRAGKSTCCTKCRDEKRTAGLREYIRARKERKMTYG